MLCLLALTSVTERLVFSGKVQPDRHQGPIDYSSAYIVQYTQYQALDYNICS